MTWKGRRLIAERYKSTLAQEIVNPLTQKDFKATIYRDDIIFRSISNDVEGLRETKQKDISDEDRKHLGQIHLPEITVI